MSRGGTFFLELDIANGPRAIVNQRTAAQNMIYGHAG